MLPYVREDSSSAGAKCLGAPLARMEMRIAFPALLKRFPRLAVAEPAEFRHFTVVFGLKSLPVTW